MNRKLHNTVMALIASTSLFVLGLLTSHPVMPDLSVAQASAAATGFDAETAVASESAGENEQARATAPRGHVRRAARHSLAMPFFSFAPRG